MVEDKKREVKKRPPVDEFAWQEYDVEEFKRTFPALRESLRRNLA